MENQNGFVALISTIIITALLLVLTMSLSTASFALSGSSLEASEMIRARAVAESCGRFVLLRLSADPRFVGNTAFFIQGQVCKISVIDFSDLTYLKFQTTAVVNHAVAGVEFLVQKNSMEIITSTYIPVAQ